MKKKFISFLFAGVLCMTSCTEIFEPTVDYGDQTYINDYSELVSAVNNLNKSMSERFEALNQLLDKNMTDIKLAIDGNTGAIKVIGETMENGLSSINTTLFNGFSALSTQIDETGKQIVYAMNNNGELLRLQIDATGKLLSAQIETSTKKLNETINSLTATLADKFDALSLITQAGLADISLKIDNVDKTLDVQLGNVNTNLGTLNTTMFDGFKALNTTITDNGNSIITAMNDNGELLRLQIDATGQLISAEIVKSQKELIDAINSQTTSLEAKFNALHGMIQDGFADVTLKIGNVGDQLHLDIQGVNTSLGTINTNLTAGFTTLGTKVDDNGQKIVEAINAEGDKLEIALDKNGNVISTAIEDFNKEYTNTEAANLAQMGEILKAINTLNTSIGTMDTNEAKRNQEIIDRLEKILAKDNIYTSTKPGEEGEVIYMSPSKFQQIQEAGPGSNIYTTYANQITERKVVIDCVQVVNEPSFAAGGETARPAAGTSSGPAHGHADFTATGGDGTAILVADPPKVEDFSNGIPVVRVIKTPTEKHYSVAIQTGKCNSKYIYKITIIDVNGRNDTTFSPTYPSASAFILNVYNGTNIADKVTAFVYCTTSDNSIAYQ